MKWASIEAEWTRLRPRFHARWRQLTQKELADIAGKRGRLVSRLEAHYHFDRRKAEQRADAFARALD